MIAEYVLLAGRIRRELADLERAVARAERAARAAKSEPADSQLYIDSASLNLHGFYTGLERTFQQIAEIVDESLPAGTEWHRALLEQMCIEFPGVRPQCCRAQLARHSTSSCGFGTSCGTFMPTT